MINLSHYKPTKNIYTKLEDVLKPKKLTKDELNDFPSVSYKKITKNEESSGSSQVSATQKLQNTLGTQIYVSSFINALQENKGMKFLDTEEVIRKIEKEYEYITGDNSKGELGGKTAIIHEDICPNDNNFLQLANDKIEFNKKKYQIDTSKLEGIEKLSINEEELLRQQNEKNYQNPISEQYRKRKAITSKRFKILKDCLIQLKSNNISIEEFTRRNPFQQKPYQVDRAIDFFDAVKFDKPRAVDNFLKNNKDYLFCYDFFRQTAYHWAAKRGHLRVLSLLLQYGKHCNQLDINHRTPLYLAAASNQYKVCMMLVDNGGNPLIPDKAGKLPSDVTTSQEIRSYLLSAGDSISVVMKLIDKK